MRIQYGNLQLVATQEVATQVATSCRTSKSVAGTNFNGEPQLKVLKSCDTRWLSFSSAVNNLHQIMNSVLAAINDDAMEGDKQAEFLLDQLDQEFISTTMFLADLANILKKLINIFQLENLSISNFIFHLNNTIKEITSEFIGYEEALPNYGVIFKNYLDESGNSVPSFVKEYSLAIIDAIKNRFPESELYFSFKIFDPKELPDN